MAQRQQQQISAQQQLLTAKESRLKYLRQQETRVANSAAADAERLRHLRERVEAQELKLRKLRALRGQVDQQKINNNGLTSDLDSIRALFNEKEKELNLAVARVEELTRQLDEMRLRRQSRNNQQLLPAQSNQLEALRRELLYRNRLTEAQAVRVSQQQEVLSAKHKEMARIDTRIAELQQRLHRKRMLNQQLARQISSSKINQASKNVVNARARMANVAAVEPFQHIPHQPQEEKESPEFHPTKGDACGKYQTLPANTKLLSAEEGEKGEEGSSSVTTATSVSNGIYSSAAAGAGGQRTPGSTSNNRPQVLPMTARPIRPVPPPKPQSPQTPQQMVQVPRQYTSVYPSSGAVTTSSPTTSAPIGITKIPQASSGTQKPVHTVAPTQQHARQNPNTPSSPGTTGPSRPSPPHTLISVSNASPPAPSSSAALEGTTPPGNEPSNVTAPPASSATTKSKPQSGLHHQDDLRQFESTPSPNNGNQVPFNRYMQQTLSQNVYSLAVTPNASPLDNAGLEVKSLQPATVSSADEAERRSESKELGGQQPNLGGGESMGVHVSINSRIRMPPENLFPELGEGGHPTNIEPEEDTTDRAHISSGFPEEFYIDEEGNLQSRSIKEDQNCNESDEASPQENRALVVISNAEEKHVHSILQKGRRKRQGNLSPNNNANNNAVKSTRNRRRVSFDPLALMLDASLEGELELVKKCAVEVLDPSASNDEGITALHNAVCAGHFDIVKFLVEFGCDVNPQDSDGWTPLHCAASCNNLQMVQYLVERGACIFASTQYDHETAAQKCEEDEDGYDNCSEYLYSIQEKLGILNGGRVYALYHYQGHNDDELSFKEGDCMVVIRKGDENEREWWWSRHDENGLAREGYVPRNLLGLYPRLKRIPAPSVGKQEDDSPLPPPPPPPPLVDDSGTQSL